MTLAEEKPDEETHFDRRKKYKDLVAGGMSDKVATESVWPSTTANIAKNAKEAADKKEQTAKKGN
ncbi:TPA: hypothetical protein HA225_01865 [Candidatus Micrarchaeota archaeon]|nr:hypothetical protein [Candidatus Micrarchaeota archaeon]HIH29981.1 hypothetical protein [Candidatus Micrarchaeota archaeon]